jgi:hypothetical protein
MSEGENSITNFTTYQWESLSSQRSREVRVLDKSINSIEAQRMANNDLVVVIRQESDGATVVYIPYDIFLSEINLTHSTNIVAEDLKDYADKDLEELRTNPESEERHEDFSEDEPNERFSDASYCLVFDPDCPVMQQMAEKYSIPFKQMLGHERGMIYLPHDWLQDYCGIYELPRGIDKNSVTVITQNNSSMTVEIGIPDQTYNGRFHLINGRLTSAEMGDYSEGWARVLSNAIPDSKIIRIRDNEPAARTLAQSLANKRRKTVHLNSEEITPKREVLLEPVYEGDYRPPVGLRITLNHLHIFKLR